MMKKYLTLLVGLIAVLAVKAQNDFPLLFTDKEGQVIADGSVLTFTDCEYDAFGDPQMPTNLWVKNISDVPVQGGGQYTIQSISNGSFQTCFPINCVRQTAPGDYTTGNDTFAPGQLRSMMTEWFPASEGVCTVTYQLCTYRLNPNSNRWLPDGNGPTITLNFNYGTAFIKDCQVQKDVVSFSYYDLRGQQTEKPVQGLYIKKTTYTNGANKTEKLFIR